MEFLGSLFGGGGGGGGGKTASAASSSSIGRNDSAFDLSTLTPWIVILALLVGVLVVVKLVVSSK